MDSRYAIRAARPDDVAVLPGIERAASARFRDLGVTMPDEVTALADLEDARVNGRLWVAVRAADVPVGFVLADVLDGAAHLEEIDVHPDHGGRGIGAALVATVCAWALVSRHSAVTLSTARDVPWNAPWYARLGFRIVAESEYTPALRALRAREIEDGLTHPRVVMRRDLAP